jgi:hypothetical protein
LAVHASPPEKKTPGTIGTGGVGRAPFFVLAWFGNGNVRIAAECHAAYFTCGGERIAWLYLTEVHAGQWLVRNLNAIIH